jgi:hypothetical protein
MKLKYIYIYIYIYFLTKVHRLERLFTSIVSTTASGQSDLSGIGNQCSNCTSITQNKSLTQLFCWKFITKVSRDSITVKWLALILHIWESWVQNLMGCALLVEVFHGFTKGISVHILSDSSVTNHPI